MVLPSRSSSGRDTTTRPELLELIEELKKIQTSMLELESSINLGQFGARRESARNLLHYVALRRQDIREIQEKLSAMGVSSLGRSESHVLYTLNSVIRILQGIARETAREPTIERLTPFIGREILERNADALFGPKEDGRAVRMMVTMPSEAGSDYTLVRDLVATGMDCMRINCAHDSEPTWLSMISNLRDAEKEVGRRCRVLMDISGPRLRTGRIEPGPRVMRLRPERDPFGRVTSPATVTFTAKGSAKQNVQGPTPLEVQARWLQELWKGGRIDLVDSRGAKRSLKVTLIRSGLARAESRKTIYLDPSTKLTFRKGRRSYSTTVLNIPYTENPIVLKKGETLLVTSSQEPGRPSALGEPARIPCSLPEALSYVRTGERIWLDDGKIGGSVRSTSKEEVEVEITHASSDGTKLTADKGINLPDTSLKLPPLTAKDLVDLRFIVGHSDIVGYSFVSRPDDLQVLRSELAKLGRKDMGIILKIETRKAFEQLPSLLLESMRGEISGVMIARGDLAVECGYDRLAEVQEEILWMSEAAHMPTIWATQVLEGLTKNGIPSRAEVTDAAVGQRSECVMLNKGPHIVEALKALDSILRRMQAHQVKKRAMLRQLRIADSFSKAITD
jgi:pyruvate kinase